MAASVIGPLSKSKMSDIEALEAVLPCIPLIGPHARLLKLALLGSNDVLQTLGGVEHAAWAMADVMIEILTSGSHDDRAGG